MAPRRERKNFKSLDEGRAATAGAYTVTVSR